MKVAILAHDRFPIAAPFAGGLESFTWQLTRGLKDRGVDVVLFAGPGSDPSLEAEELQVQPVILSEDARVDVAMPPESQVMATMAYAQAMRALAERADVDVVHNNSLHYLPIVMSTLIPQPMITTLHTPPHPWLEPALRLTETAKTVAVSRWVAKRWSSFTTARVIHNGADPMAWSLGPGGDDLVWFGRIVPEKAPHRAAMIARHAGRKLRLIGPIIDAPYFRTHVAPLLNDDITYVGHLGPRPLSDVVGSSSACLVTPEWEEPYGLVAAEAMTCGTPVLSLHRGGLPEIVRAPGGLCVDPEESLDAMASALEEVIEFDRAEVRHHAQQNCSLDAMIDGYVDLYEDLL